MDSTALIVMDILNDFTSKKGTMYVPGSESVIDNVNRLQQRFETIVFMKDCHPEDDPEFKRVQKHCVSGSWGSQPDNRLNIKGSAAQVEKRAWSMFSNRTAYTQLAGAGVNIVCLAGVPTEYSIFESAMDAVRLGFRVFLVADAIAGIDQAKTVPAVLKMGKIGVLSMSTEDMLRASDLRIIH